MGFCSFYRCPSETVGDDLFCCNKCRDEYDEFFIATLDINYVARLKDKRKDTREKILSDIASRLEVDKKYLKEHIYFLLWEMGWIETKNIEDRRLVESILTMKKVRIKFGVRIKSSAKREVNG